MPLPTPSKDKPEKAFISRCMEFQDKEKNLSDEKVRKQAVAICFKQFRESNDIPEGSPKSMYQILIEKGML